LLKSKLAVITTAVLLSACDDTTLGTRSFEETLDEIIIPGAPVSLGTLTLPEIKFPLDLKDQQGYSSLDFVTSVNVRSATFTISPRTDNPNVDQFADNSPDNFDFLGGLSLSLIATVNGTSQTVRVASLPEGDPQIGSNATALNLVVDNIDIRDFVEAPDVQMAVVASGTIPPDFVVIDPVVRFRVGVGVR